MGGGTESHKSSSQNNAFLSTSFLWSTVIRQKSLHQQVSVDAHMRCSNSGTFTDTLTKTTRVTGNSSIDDQCPPATIF